ncbi:MAG: hypothetical protein R6W48_07880 [Gaiellaceae bacterium]
MRCIPLVTPDGEEVGTACGVFPDELVEIVIDPEALEGLDAPDPDVSDPDSSQTADGDKDVRR